jgi:hypothetical protein
MEGEMSGDADGRDTSMKTWVVETVVTQRRFYHVEAETKQDAEAAIAGATPVSEEDEDEIASSVVELKP